VGGDEVFVTITDISAAIKKKKSDRRIGKYEKNVSYGAYPHVGLVYRVLDVFLVRHDCLRSTPIPDNLGYYRRNGYSSLDIISDFEKIV